jgi:hypothetical protein
MLARLPEGRHHNHHILGQHKQKSCHSHSGLRVMMNMMNMMNIVLSIILSHIMSYQSFLDLPIKNGGIFLHSPILNMTWLHLVECSAHVSPSSLGSSGLVDDALRRAPFGHWQAPSSKHIYAHKFY